MRTSSNPSSVPTNGFDEFHQILATMSSEDVQRATEKTLRDNPILAKVYSGISAAEMKDYLQNGTAKTMQSLGDMLKNGVASAKSASLANSPPAEATFDSRLGKSFGELSADEQGEFMTKAVQSMSNLHKNGGAASKTMVMDMASQMFAVCQNAMPPLNVAKTHKFIDSLGPDAKAISAQSASKLFNLCLVQSHLQSLMDLNVPALCMKIYGQHAEERVREDAMAALNLFYMVADVCSACVRRFNIFPFVFDIMANPAATPCAKLQASYVFSMFADISIWKSFIVFTASNPRAILSLLHLLSDRTVDIRPAFQHVTSVELGHYALRFLHGLLGYCQHPDELPFFTPIVKVLSEPAVGFTTLLQRLAGADGAARTRFQQQCNSVLELWLPRVGLSNAPIVSFDDHAKAPFDYSLATLAIAPVHVSSRVLLCALPSCAQSDDKLFRCSRCREVRYCSVECQRTHWKQHKSTCVVAQSSD